MDPHARRVLVCLRYGIGDVVMEQPVLDALRRALPAARITALGAEPAVQLVEGSAAVDEVAALQRWGFRHRWDPGPPDAGAEITEWLDEHDFDLFLDVNQVTRGFGEMVWRRGVRSLESDPEAEAAAVRSGEGGVRAIQAAVAAGWGLDVPGGALPELRLPGDARRFAEAYLAERGMDGTAPLAFSPVASLALKRWPVERLARVADRLVGAAGEPFLVFCGPDRASAEAMRRAMRHGARAVAVGPLHLLRIAALLERCRGFVCNDTGLMHMAGALGVPTTAVFGPTAPSVYRPPSPSVASVGGAIECPHRSTTSLHPPGCFTEGRCLIGAGSCIETITEDEVADAARAMLRRAEPPRRALSAA